MSWKTEMAAQNECKSDETMQKPLRPGSESRLNTFHLHGPQAFEYLAKAGKWALDVATKIGTPVAIAALQKALGM